MSSHRAGRCFHRTRSLSGIMLCRVKVWAAGEGSERRWEAGGRAGRPRCRQSATAAQVVSSCQVLIVTHSSSSAPTQARRSCLLGLWWHRASPPTPLLIPLASFSGLSKDPGTPAADPTAGAAWPGRPGPDGLPAQPCQHSLTSKVSRVTVFVAKSCEDLMHNVKRMTSMQREH